MLVVLAVVMVGYLGGGLLGIFDLMSGGNTNSTQTQTDVLTQLSQKYTPTVTAYNAALASDPTSFTVLVNMGNTYFDWGMAVVQASSTNQTLVGAEQPMWLSARTFYERAVKVKGDEPNVNTDLAIAYFYSGETSQAIATALAVTTTQADFAPAWFNLGVFYNASGQNSAAIAAFEKTLELDPEGKVSNKAYAEQTLASLKGGSAPTSP